jgi:ATP-dependent Lhr-like helicase
MEGLAFDPLVAGWFAEHFKAATPPQEAGWREIAAGRDTLIAAPTGSGKTLAAFLWAINGLTHRAREGRLPEKTCVLYISPLKALGNDIEKNLEIPLGGIRARAEAEGVLMENIRVAVRSGDTPASERQRMLRKPPHILITTPESLYILLTAEKSRRMLENVETVLVDEVHAICGDKRGAHLALSLERLDQLITSPEGGPALARPRPQRIGLSATQKPIEEIARWLVGCTHLLPDGSADCSIVDTGHKRAMQLSIETAELELSAIASHEMRDAIYDRIVELSGQHRTTIVFVNTRRLVERVSHALGERLGAELVVAHHGSLSKKIRLEAEAKLKSGDVPVVVATASLELGIDVGHVDLVCHLGAPRAIATLLQRVGRSGHWLGQVPHGVFFPLTRDEMVQTAAAVRAIRMGELDRILMPENCRDILAQQIVATVATGEIGIAEIEALVRRAWPWRNLDKSEFDAIIEMLAEGVSTRRGRRSAHLHFDRVNGRLRARRGARLAAITGGGAIPDTGNYDVIEEPTEARVGTVDEDFAVESMRGDIFQLGNHSWRVRRVELGKVRVEDAGQIPPTIPFWFGEAPARTRELSDAVSDLREEVATRLPNRPALLLWLMEECGIDQSGAEQITEYIAATVHELGCVPTGTRLIAERFFDESGGMQLVIHAPLGGAINRAFGLALRKRFCVGFDFELQAAATDDGIVLSLGEQHSFPLPSLFDMVHPDRVESDLIQAVLAAPMFTNRWRWNATRALTLARSMGGKRVPIHLQRMRAEDLVAAVFPAQLGCGDNRIGPIELVDHPLVNETIDNCLHEAMDTEGLKTTLRAIRAGDIDIRTIETPSPSPMAHEILNANPYAFLDDAPLEERRARAVSLRRTDDTLARGLGQLDAAAIADVRAQAWPDIRTADELHDALLDFVWLAETELDTPATRGPNGGAAPDTWRTLFFELVGAGRATLARHPDPAGGERRVAVVAERIVLARLALPGLACERELKEVPEAQKIESTDAALVIALRGWLECSGPTTSTLLAARLGVSTAAVESALAHLENDGIAMRGSFTPGTAQEEWCDRRLLARIHRNTLGRLRAEIDPVSPADFMRFLFRWQHIGEETRLHGSDGTAAVIQQLHGLEIPAPAWEQSVLPLRIQDYVPGLLDQLCLGGVVVWGRFSPPVSHPDKTRRASAPSRSAPLGLVMREELDQLFPEDPGNETPTLSHAAADALAFLGSEGASFLPDVARGTGLLPTATEDALWELVARGLVTGDGFAGLRILLSRDAKKRPERRLRSVRGGRVRTHSLPIGRWALLRRQSRETDTPASAEEAAAEDMVRLALRRWGVVFREVLSRESLLPPWRVMLHAMRRLEARGEIRGGRFVSGFVGEQFATPEAVDALRSVRRSKDSGATLLVAAADPLNLVGILTPGGRVSPQSNSVIAYRGGVPLEVGELGQVRSRLQLP